MKRIFCVVLAIVILTLNMYSCKKTDLPQVVDADNKASETSQTSEFSDTQTELKEWWIREFKIKSLEKDYIQKIISYSDNGLVAKTNIYNETSLPDFLNIIATGGNESNDIGDKTDDIGCFTLYKKNIRYNGDFYSLGVRLTRTDEKGDRIITNIALSENDLDAARYRYLLFIEQDGLSPICLANIDFSKVIEIKAIPLDSKDTLSFDEKNIKSENIVINEILGLKVKRGSYEKAENGFILENATNINIKYKNLEEYHIQINKYKIAVSSNLTKDVYLYNLDNFNSCLNFNELNNLIKREIENKLNDNNSNSNHTSNNLTGKPVIYLYPRVPTDVSVKVDFIGDFLYTYPEYNNGWNVTAYPDGKLINKSDNSEHYYLFWDGYSNQQWSFDEGFIVAGKDTEKFLKESLVTLGLTPKEYNDFLVYWVPMMKNNKYNLIKFASADEYNRVAPMEISPKPDTLLRVHMVYKAIDKPFEIKPQQLKPFERKGFCAVEWGGTRLN